MFDMLLKTNKLILNISTALITVQLKIRINIIIVTYSTCF